MKYRVKSSAYGTLMSLVALILCSASAIAQEANFNGNTYRLVVGEFDWDTASAACNNSGGDLVTVTSQQETDFLASFVNGNEIWAGGRQPLGQATPSAGWQWVTGEQWSFTNWNSGEPNDNNDAEGDEEPVDQENCLEFRSDGLWNDDECVDPHNYVCEITAQSAPATPVPSLAEWALLTLALLLGLIGIVGVRRVS